MAEHDPGNVTVLIRATREGDEAARDRLFALVYDELRRIAARRPGVGRQGETMQATALVHEAYLFFEKRFPEPPCEERENREVFYRTAALANALSHAETVIPKAPVILFRLIEVRAPEKIAFYKNTF